MTWKVGSLALATFLAARRCFAHWRCAARKDAETRALLTRPNLHSPDFAARWSGGPSRRSAREPVPRLATGWPLRAPLTAPARAGSRHPPEMQQGIYRYVQWRRL